MERWMVCAFLGALCAPAWAQEGNAPDWANKRGAVGVGAERSLGGANGLHIRTYVSPLFGIQGTIGFQMVSANLDPSDAPDDELRSTNLLFTAGIYGTYKLAYWQRGSLSVLFGGDVQTSSSSIDVAGTDFDTETSGTDILIGLGLQGEWFPTQYLSIFAQGGLRLDLLNDEDFAAVQVGGAPEPLGIELDLGADLLGQFGFTVWFQ